MEDSAVQADQVYLTINRVADGCGFPAGTVKATAPGLHTCEGAVVKYTQLWPGTSGAGVCKQSCDTECNHKPATCKTDECEAAIRSIDDQAWACWKKGFQV